MAHDKLVQRIQIDVTERAIRIWLPDMLDGSFAAPQDASGRERHIEHSLLLSYIWPLVTRDCHGWFRAFFSTHLCNTSLIPASFVRTLQFAASLSPFCGEITLR
jgi:hypothetical protein